MTEQLKPGQRVMVKTSPSYKGVVLDAYPDRFCVRWDDGSTGHYYKSPEEFGIIPAGENIDGWTHQELEAAYRILNPNPSYIPKTNLNLAQAIRNRLTEWNPTTQGKILGRLEHIAAKLGVHDGREMFTLEDVLEMMEQYANE